MRLTAPSSWSQSIGTGGRDPSERVVTIVVARTRITHAAKLEFSSNDRSRKPGTGHFRGGAHLPSKFGLHSCCTGRFVPTTDRQFGIPRPTAFLDPGHRAF
jgi:hypothetical protein